MKLPYESATSGEKAMTEIQKILRKFSCSKFATGTDFETGEVFVQFEHKKQLINLKVNAKNYAASWLKENPYNSRRKSTKQEHESKALDIGNLAIYSLLRDWIKGQVTMIEIGCLSFEAAFLSHIMLPNGKVVLEEIRDKKVLIDIAITSMAT